MKHSSSILRVFGSAAVIAALILGSGATADAQIARRTYSDLLANQIEGTIGAAAAAMRSLDVIPGRKALIMLSGGWPMNVDDWVGRSPSRSIEESRIPSDAGFQPVWMAMINAGNA